MDRGGREQNSIGHRKNVFLSFSASKDLGDRNFVRRLLKRLGDQPLNPWIYESAAGEITLGRPIDEACRERIDRCDLFLAYLTPAAFRSAYVASEVAYAVGRRERLVIAPVVSARIAQLSWPAVFETLRGLRGFMLPSDELSHIDDIVNSVCGSLDVAYVSARRESPRLPLRKRIAEELSGHYDRASSHDAGRFADVVRGCDLAASAYDAGDLDQVERRLVSIDVQLADYFPGVAPYYTRIVTGVLMLDRARHDPGQYPRARVHFKALIGSFGQRVDANAYAGLANAELGCCEPAAALASFRQADSMLEVPDPASFYNIVRASVLANVSLARAEIEERRSRASTGLVAQQPGDISRHFAVLALAFAHGGFWRDAGEAWTRVQDKGEVASEVVAEIAQALTKDDVIADRRGALARQILGEHLAAASNEPIDRFPAMHMAARLAFEAGDQGAACDMLEELIGQFPRNPVLRVDLAMYYVARHRLADARTHARQVVGMQSETECTPPIGASEFNYALGQAFWLIGDRPAAREAFRRSQYPVEFDYEHRLHGWLGQLA
jgi:hypothetical protein